MSTKKNIFLAPDDVLSIVRVLIKNYLYEFGYLRGARMSKILERTVEGDTILTTRHHTPVLVQDLRLKF